MKDKNITGILALFFGVFGVHRFYLGHTARGILCLIFFWTFIPAIIGLIDAIIFLSMDPDEFDYKYNRSRTATRPDHRRYDTDFDRVERQQYRAEQKDLRQQRRRERQERVRQRNQPSNPPRRKPASRPNIINNPFKKSGIEKYKDFDYEGAIEDFIKALEITPKDIAVHFNIACAYSLSEEKENAFFHLSKAVELGFVDFDKIQEHDALAYLRIQDEFEVFKKNGYKLNVPIPPSSPPSGNPDEEVSEKAEDLLSKNSLLLEQIKRLGELRDRGLLTASEFEAQKRKLLD